MQTKTYNGWTNYETWAVALWQDNDCSTYQRARDLARECLESTTATRYSTKEQQAAYDLSHLLKEEMEECQPRLEGVWADLLSAALSEVNWHEIALNLIDEVRT